MPLLPSFSASDGRADRSTSAIPTFIEESGDTGHESDSASPFRLGAVGVLTQDAAEAFRADIQQRRRDLGLPERYEVKFAKTGSHPERREAFFRAALGHSFQFAAASLDKCEGGWRTANREAIHWACAVSLTVTRRPTYRAQENARAVAGHNRRLRELVVVDDNQDLNFLAGDQTEIPRIGLGTASQSAVGREGQVLGFGTG